MTLFQKMLLSYIKDMKEGKLENFYSNFLNHRICENSIELL